MNILFLNTTWLCGGAEKVTNQIFQGMKARGHQVYEIVSYYKRPEPLAEGVSVLYSGKPMLLLNRLMTGNHSNASLTIPYSRKYILRFIRRNHIDLVHLHNAHGNFLGIDDIRAISELCPIVWTLHDFWALTGHCTYPTGCPDLWKEGCSRCPQLQNYPPLRKDRSKQLLNAKKEAFETSRIHYVVPSDWMKQQVENSHLSGQSCACIPNSLDPSLWIPYPRQELLSRYHLPDDKHILAFVAADPQKKLKGMDLLMEALDRIPNPSDYLLLIAGRENDLSQMENLGFSVRHFGYITDQTRMNEFYSLADLLVNPSVYETFGLVNIEAMACETPVIAFSVCAMEEIITPDTGWCLPEISGAALSQAIQEAFSSPEELCSRALAARQRVLERFSEKGMLDAYEALYQKAVSR